MDPQQALNMGHVVNRNGTTELEDGTEAIEIAKLLEAKGHKVKITRLNSGLHAIQLKGDKLIGAADPRRDGLVLGN
jgi:gamma-glutamyltranspeptidase/glutathione hydrolase